MDFLVKNGLEWWTVPTLRDDGLRFLGFVLENGRIPTLASFFPSGQGCRSWYDRRGRSDRHSSLASFGTIRLGWRWAAVCFTTEHRSGSFDPIPSSRMRPDDWPEPGNVPPIAQGRPGGLGEPGRHRGHPGGDDLDAMGLETGAPQLPVLVDRRPCWSDCLRGQFAGDPQGASTRWIEPESG